MVYKCLQDLAHDYLSVWLVPYSSAFHVVGTDMLDNKCKIYMHYFPVFLTSVW